MVQKKKKSKILKKEIKSLKYEKCQTCRIRIFVPDLWLGDFENAVELSAV